MLHLIEVYGYRRIAFIEGPEGNQEAEQRYRIYREEPADHGLALILIWSRSASSRPKWGQRP